MELGRLGRERLRNDTSRGTVPNGVMFSDPFGLKSSSICPPCLEEALEFAEDEAPAVEEAAEQVVAKGSELARNLQQSGAVRQADEAAHHIVAQAAQRAAPAREALAQVGVKINDAVNGVFLPAVKDYAGQAMNHLTLHTHEYYDAVNKLLTTAEGHQEVVAALNFIKEGLLNGTFTR